MKKLIFIAAITCLFSCKKENTPDPEPQPITQLPYTKIVGHTWRGLVDVDDLDTHYYEFLHFKTDTTVGVYVASYDESVNFVPEIIYPCKITTYSDHDDTISILYPGDSTMYYTTNDTTIISDGYKDYKRVR